MAKFELPIYKEKSGKVEKTYKRDFISVSLFLKYQKINEELLANKMLSDEEFLNALKELFLETFPDLTEEEYLNGTDVGQVIFLCNSIIRKATKFQSGNSKNE